jgi:hypothetical protein
MLLVFMLSPLCVPHVPPTPPVPQNGKQVVEKKNKSIKSK